MANDGFCAESLNVQLDMGEVAPAVRPKAVTDASGNPVNVDGDILYIHKGVGYENLLYRSGNTISYVATMGGQSSGTVYGNLFNDEVVNDVTSIGNTVIVSTDNDMYYILWKEGAYHFLGNCIPIPDIHFRISTENERKEITDRALPTAASAPELFDSGGNFMPDDWTAMALAIASVGADINIDKVSPSTSILGKAANKYRLEEETQKQWLNEIWGIVDDKMATARESGKTSFPIFVRYAVRLYDGTYYAQSIPVLLGADISRFVKIRTGVCSHFYGVVDENTGISHIEAMVQIPQKELEVSDPSLSWINNLALHVDLPEPYSVVANFFRNYSIFEGWDDIVSGVDIFVSTPIGPSDRDSVVLNAISGFYAQEAEPEEDGYPIRFAGIYEGYLDPYHTLYNQDKLLELHQTTYLARTYTLDEFRALAGEVKLEIDFSSDYIMAQKALVETAQSMHHTKGDRLFNYNKRLLLAGAEQSLYHGYPFLHSVKWIDNDNYPSERYRIVYHLRGDNGENVIICRDEENHAIITPKNAKIVKDSSVNYHELPCSWLAYPDSRCYRIDLYTTSNGAVGFRSFQTTVFDQADVAYAFIGFGNAFTRPFPQRVDSMPNEENTTYRMPSSLVASKVNNPFAFPVEDKVTFTAGEILNMAVATRALSEGQFGQFPLYVFTDEGVFALSVDAQGKFLTNHPVSRDILISKDALAGIEQGVFFAARRGILLLQGSQVTKVSSDMDGKPVEIGDGALMARIPLDGMPVETPQPFSYYLDGCFLAYDYANARIVVFNETMNTQYVYKFDTQSWHRLRVGNAWPVRVLNSYPEAQVVFSFGNRQKVLDLSVLEESADADALPGLVYSRDLDLDTMDVYKTVRKVKVRGRFADQHVKWQLQGSNDGINYTTIHSLRGPSWKWFRIVLVTILAPGERISYVEMDYEPRFTDKIR